MIIVNFKTYSEATGWKARDLSKICRDTADESEKRIISVPQAPDLRIAEGEVFAQHVDGVKPGSNTGSILADALDDAGVDGTLLNHSERRISKEKIESSLNQCKEKNITTIVCAQTPEECRELSKLNPDYVAFEPPELIGGDTSVSSAQPELISEAVEKSEAPILTGAGIKNRGDVEKSIGLGCEGVLIASGIVKAEKPKQKLKELCKGL